MRWNSSADGPQLSPHELRTLQQIEADLRRDVDLDRILTPRRSWHRSVETLPVWIQAGLALLGLGLMVMGLLVGPVILAAPGFLALVAAMSGLSSRLRLSPATFGLAPAVGDAGEADRQG